MRGIIAAKFNFAAREYSEYDFTARGTVFLVQRNSDFVGSSKNRLKKAQTGDQPGRPIGVGKVLSPSARAHSLSTQPSALITTRDKWGRI